MNYWGSDTLGKIAIIGSGSWATAIAKMLIDNGKKINWHFRDKEKIKQFKKTGSNPGYLTAAKFDTKKISFYSDMNQMIKNSDSIFFVTPSPYLKKTLSEIIVPLKKKILISAVKGIIPNDNMVITEYLKHYFQVPDEKVCVLSGPCHAEEVAMERLAYLTIGCTNRVNARHVADAIKGSYIKTSISEDVLGMEYASVLKNVYAIAAGICSGLNYGDNFQSIIISNAIQEMNRFCATLSPVPRTISESAYLGDLLVTGYSKFSRNRTFGMMIGSGYSVKTVQLEMEMIAEGYYGTKCIKEINEKLHVNMPILDAVYNILYEKISAAVEIKLLTESLR